MLYYSSFLGFSRSFIWCFAAGKTSLTRRLTSIFSSCSNLGLKTRNFSIAFFTSLLLQLSSSSLLLPVVESSVVGGLTAFWQTVAESWAKVGKEGLNARRHSDTTAFRILETSAQILWSTSSLGPFQDTSCRDVDRFRHSRRTEAAAATTFYFCKFDH